jgi:putative FmdB family regulatory protein
MPTYVYECSKCGEEIEVWQSFTEDSLTKHPACGGKLAKVYQPVGIVLKGPGFYKTDSRNGKKSTSTSERSDSSSDSGSKSDSKSDTKSSESKSPDSKSPDSKSSDTTSSDSKKPDNKPDGRKAEKAKPSPASKPA